MKRKNYPNFMLLLLLFWAFPQLGLACQDSPAPAPQPKRQKVAGSNYIVHFNVPYDQQRYVDDRVANLLLRLAVDLEQDIFVNSGFRNCSHNTRVRGATRSNHLRAIAVDFSARPNAHTPAHKRQTYTSLQLANLAMRAGATGAGAYCGRTAHMDIGTPRSWNWCRGPRPSR